MEINIGIGEQDRAAIAEGPSRLLADTYTPLPENPQLPLERHRPDVQYAPDVRRPVHRTGRCRGRHRRAHPGPGLPAPGTYAAYARLSSIKEEEADALRMSSTATAFGVLAFQHVAVRPTGPFQPLTLGNNCDRHSDIIPWRSHFGRQCAMSFNCEVSQRSYSMSGGRTARQYSREACGRAGLSNNFRLPPSTAVSECECSVRCR